jgi:hypothetical protein
MSADPLSRNGRNDQDPESDAFLAYAHHGRLDVLLCTANVRLRETF